MSARIDDIAVFILRLPWRHLSVAVTVSFNRGILFYHIQELYIRFLCAICLVL